MSETLKPDPRYGGSVGKRWDWAGDLSFIEWLAELVGIRVGIAPSEEDLARVVKQNDHILPDNAKQKVALELLGRSALEAFGLEGAMRALERPVVLGIQDKVGDYSLAVQAMAFVAGQIFGPTHGEHFARLGRQAAYAVFPPLNISEKRAAEIIAKAATSFGELERSAVAAALDEIAFRDARNVILTGEQRIWRDVLDLSDLFASESVTASYGKFFDQRFVNYLAANFEEIGAVNWRKFEALIAEYFHRRGFKVELGAGRNDNGVDIRAWEAAVNSESPPTLIIQCKREKRKIGKVVIKALAADVRWEGAQQGLLAATVDWSPGAREVVKTRKYPVSEVNRSTLQRWLVEMRDSEKGLWLPG